jgi:uncharacterized Ntn-hydrolase superfamily protein
MTWSIVVRDPDSGAVAVAVATKAFAVGARCPYVRAGVGAVSTQSITNPMLGPAILDRLQDGAGASEALTAELASDQGRGLRQVHVVDAGGRTAAWMGTHCVTWCGHAADGPVSVAGNMLAGPAVVDATLAAMRTGAALPLPERLLAAMAAGEAVGGDRRGRQSAALLVASTESYPDISLRADDHADPLAELTRLLDVWRRTVAPRRHWTPSRARPAGETDLDVIEAAWIAAGSDLRFRR